MGLKLTCKMMGIILLPIVILSFRKEISPVEQAEQAFKTNTAALSASATALQAAVNALDQRPQTILRAREALKTCRLDYKRIEYFMEYFFPSVARTYNGAPKYEVEEGSTEENHEPEGLQLIEALLYDKEVFSHKTELSQRVALISSSAADLNALLYHLDIDNGMLLESARLEMIRILATGLSGYDAPLLKSGIPEAYTALLAVNTAIQPLYMPSAVYADSVAVYMKASLQYLEQHPDFDTFDRLHFITRYALPLQRYFGLFIRGLNLELNTTGTLDYNQENIFSPGAIRAQAFSGTATPDNPARITLGKVLFNETALSGNGRRNCATCHMPGKYFTDGLPKSLAFNGHSSVARNAPSLMYAGLQSIQFWDGRAKTLEEQVITVINNPEEMNAPGEAALKGLQAQIKYPALFASAFPEEEPGISMKHIASAIAAYIRTLQPFNAPFDQYLAGNRQALTRSQVRGFNLFMGKAQCGSCHFMPLFNSLAPPVYQLSELEILGTPGTAVLIHPKEDTDRGRYNASPLVFNDKAFKTPGLRNVAETAPYMHNGAFKTLEKVLEFYNKGGGEGIGLHNPWQTLSAIPLHLSEGEMKDIVSFLHALTDKTPVYNDLKEPVNQ